MARVCDPTECPDDKRRFLVKRDRKWQAVPARTPWRYVGGARAVAGVTPDMRRGLAFRCAALGRPLQRTLESVERVLASLAINLEASPFVEAADRAKVVVLLELTNDDARGLRVRWG